jgi:signal transduction histidine kinase/ActR/RegA family two-component response regulator
MPDPIDLTAAGAGPLRFKRLRRRVAVLGALAIGAFAASSAYDAWVAHGNTRAATRRAIDNLAVALAEQTAWTVQGVDVVLGDTARWYQNNRDKIASDRIDESLENRTAGIRQIRLITITDAQGIQRHRSRGASPPDLDVSDRSYFSAQRQRGSELYMSEPLLSRSMGRAAIVLSRRLEDASGAFAGVVAAIVDLDDLARYYSAVNLGNGDAVQLLRDTGTLYVRNPWRPGVIGKRFPQLLAAPRDPLPITNPVDGDSVFLAVAPVRDTPLIIAVSRNARVAMQPWREETIRMTTRTVIVSLLGVIAIAALWRQLRRVEQGERALRESEHRRAQSQKLEAIGTLAGGIAHDFNNILGAILGYGELAQQEAHRPSLRRYVDNVMHAAERAKALVDLILGFSRSGIGERTLVNIQAVIEEVLELITASLPPGVRLDTTLSAGDAALVGDATHLHQVAMNLCKNAVDAMEHGGVLSVLLERAELSKGRAMSRGTLAPGRYVRLVIQDTGPGISAAVLDRIFDPFFTTRPVGEGTGLGLSLVHGIILDLGGAIDVRTAPAVGTRFEVWLPAAAETEKVAAPRNGELPHGRGETVMIVDDERMLVALTEEMLGGLDYEPVGFASSTAALAAFRAKPERFDAVLTDEAMPGLKGTELAAEIRRLRPAIPIIFMSGHGGASLAASAAPGGANAVLHKPLSRADLAQALAHALHSQENPSSA